MMIIINHNKKVQIIKGKHKDSTGKVLKVFRKKNSVLVEGVNLVKKHVKSTQDFKGGIFTKEAPIHYSKVQLIDPKTKLLNYIYKYYNFFFFLENLVKFLLKKLMVKKKEFLKFQEKLFLNLFQNMLKKEKNYFKVKV